MRTALKSDDTQGLSTVLKRYHQLRCPEQSLQPPDFQREGQIVLHP